jgi:hypothetical protein
VLVVVDLSAVVAVQQELQVLAQAVLVELVISMQAELVQQELE